MGTRTRRLLTVSEGLFSLGTRRSLHLPDPGSPKKIACRYAMNSNMEAVVENRLCSAGCRKSLYGARRTVAGGIFKALSSKAGALLCSVWFDVDVVNKMS